MAWLQNQLAIYTEKYEILTKREKILIAMLLIIAPIYLIYSLVIDPMLESNNYLKNQITSQLQTITQNTIRRDVLKFQSTQDPDQQRRKELQDLNKVLDELNAELAKTGNSMISPSQMNTLLSQLVIKSGNNLKMVEIISEPPISILAETQAANTNTNTNENQNTNTNTNTNNNNNNPESNNQSDQNDQSFDLVKHGVTITLTGHYQELANYIHYLENAPQKLIWGKMEYQVSQYPNAVMRITVYSLSEQHTWMEF